VEYILSKEGEKDLRGGKGISVVACDLDQVMLEKGLAFTAKWKQQITPVLSSYAHIDQI